MDRKYSVLIPVYNVEKFLKQCVDSVLNQTYNNFEIILINDGSTDNSGIICDEYACLDNRIKVFHQNNQGQFLTRRKAIENSSGDFCLFLDSDDYWDNNLLEIINYTITIHSCELVIFNYKRVDEKGQFLYNKKEAFDNNSIFDNANKELIFKKIITSFDLNHLVCKAASKNIIDNYVNYEKYKLLRNGEDLLQSLPLLYNANKIVYIDRCLYNYRVNSSSITNEFRINSYRDMTFVRETLLNYIIKMKFDSRENLSLFYNFYIVNILKYIYGLLTSKSILFKEKCLILDDIKKQKLYIDSFNFVDKRRFRKREMVYYNLFNHNKYLIMYIISKIFN